MRYILSQTNDPTIVGKGYFLTLCILSLRSHSHRSG
jgi:hypothetical protein